MTVVALAGGIGAARFLRGLVRAIDPRRLVVVVNTADDIRLHGLHVSPDLDTVMYSLGGGAHPEQGWGRADETFTVSEELAERYGEPTWFTLGDRDIATHLVRTRIIGGGGTLSQATAVLTRAWNLPFRMLPMSDQPVTTRIATDDGRVLHFQEWWVGEQAKPGVAEVRFDGIDRARPAPGVLEALGTAETVILCPSNPTVSIGPILAVPGVREKLVERTVVGVSPVVGGAVVRGMADKLMAAAGLDVSAAEVARGYADVLDGWVIDRVDAQLATDIEALGIPVRTTDTIMASEQVTTNLAAAVMDLAAGVR